MTFVSIPVFVSLLPTFALTSATMTSRDSRKRARSPSSAGSLSLFSDYAQPFGMPWDQPLDMLTLSQIYYEPFSGQMQPPSQESGLPQSMLADLDYRTFTDGTGSFQQHTSRYTGSTFQGLASDCPTTPSKRSRPTLKSKSAKRKPSAGIRKKGSMQTLDGKWEFHFIRDTRYACHSGEWGRVPELLEAYRSFAEQGGVISEGAVNLAIKRLVDRLDKESELAGKFYNFFGTIHKAVMIKALESYIGQALIQDHTRSLQEGKMMGAADAKWLSDGMIALISCFETMCDCYPDKTDFWRLSEYTTLRTTGGTSSNEGFTAVSQAAHSVSATFTNTLPASSSPPSTGECRFKPKSDVCEPIQFFLI